MTSDAILYSEFDPPFDPETGELVGDYPHHYAPPGAAGQWYAQGDEAEVFRTYLIEQKIGQDRAKIAPQEITEVATKLVRSSEPVWKRLLRALPTEPRGEVLNAFRDLTLEAHTGTLALYQAAVLAASRADSAEQVGAIWKTMLLFSRAMQEDWDYVRGLGAFDSTSWELIEKYRELLTKLENTALDAYQLHQPK